MNDETNRATEARGVAGNFKKNDVAYWVQPGEDSSGRAIFWVDLVVIQSWGKKQGTCTIAKDGKNALRQLYRASSVVLWDRPEVEAFAAKVGPERSARSIEQKRRLYERVANDQTGFYTDKARAEARTQLETVIAPSPTFEVRYR